MRTGIHVGVDVLINRMPRAKLHLFFGLLARRACSRIIVHLWAPFRLWGTVPTPTSVSPDTGAEVGDIPEGRLATPTSRMAW